MQALGLLALRPGHWLGVGQGSEGLVAPGRQQQLPFKVAPKAFALGEPGTEVTEAESLVLQGAQGRETGLPLVMATPYLAIGAQGSFYFNKVPNTL